MKRYRTRFAVLLLLGCAWFFYRNDHQLIQRESAPDSRESTSSPTARDQVAAPNLTPLEPANKGTIAEVSNPAPTLDRQPAQAPPLPATARRSIPVTTEFVRQLVNGADEVSIKLPDGRTASGTIQFRNRTPEGRELGVTGRLRSPSVGMFNFYLNSEDPEKGNITGAAIFDKEQIAFSVLPGENGSNLLTELPVDLVICRSNATPPESDAPPEEALPSEYPTTVGIPAYQNGVIPLQSNPSSTKVIYLDYDGEKGPFAGWGPANGTGYFDAASPNATNAQIKEVWTRVCEDYAGFNVNITTDLQVFLNAPTTSRQRIIVTPTTDAAPGAGGVAYLNSFYDGSQKVCWSFYSTGKNAAEVIAHEVGHTLSLSHDGRNSPAEGYYLGHGTDPVGWAPIMGAGYYKALSQWSKGEYLSANNTEDDVTIIGNRLGIKADDAGATHAAAALLEIFGTGTVDTEGTIETRTDVDAFRFTTTGGAVNLTIADASPSPNLDILASIYDASGTLVLSNNPDTAITATLSTTLAAGEYTVRVDGVGRGDPLLDGYTDYGAMGQYTITGTITGAIVPDRFTIAENAAPGSSIGTPTLHNNHSGATLSYAITAGNTGNAFSIDSTTGQITVATPSALNYETLSTTWLDPATLDLTVTVTDAVNANETVRVVVTVTDVNEAPTISGGSSIAAISHTLSGTTLGTYTSSDPDLYEVCSYSIVSGNSAGKFAISSAGTLTVAGDLDSTAQSTYTLTLRATDHGSPALTSDMTVAITVVPCSTDYTPGYVNRTLYEGNSGTTISSLTSSAAFPNSPTREVKLLDFTDNTRGDNYGSTIRAWLIAPYTGTYQFWISGDNVAELYVNTAGATSPLTPAGTVTVATTYQNFAASGTQTNGTFSLSAGQVCYLEARQKETTNSDHVSVAWQIKDASNVNTIVAQQVIPGRYLAPHYLSYNSTNAYRVTAGLCEEFWDGITGTSLSTLTSLPTFPNTPARIADLPGFNSGIGSFGDNYGARIRGYVIPPSSGTYTFSISGDDATSLLLSTDSNPANAVQIASNTSATGYTAWTTNASQTSTGIALTGGVKYYIEARVKEATGGDHLSVAWSGGGIGTTTTVISDAYTEPYDSNVAPVFGAGSYSFTVPANYTLNSVAGTVAATDSAFDEIRYAILSGNSTGAFSINPRTGAIRIVNTLAAGAVYNLQIGALDSGHGWHFTPKESSVPVTITAPGTNAPPQITTNPAALGTFPAGQAVASSLASFASDPGDNLTFALVSGPSWLTVSSSGAVSGTPNYTQFGPWSFTYSVSDGVNAAVQGTATLTVGNPAGNPSILLPASGSTMTSTTGTTTGGTTTSASTSDNTYLTIREALSGNGSNRSRLSYQWSFTTPNSRSATLQVEAFHTVNSENDDFQFSVSTDGGSTFTNAILVSKTSDDNTLQTYSFTTGTSGTTIVKVADTNNSANATSLDTLSIDLLSINFPGNSTPSVSDNSFSVQQGAAIGTSIGTVSTTDADAGQTLSYSIPRGNEDGLFAISASGLITVNGSIPANSGPYSLIVVATDNGSPVLAGYGTVNVNVVNAIPASITLGNLAPTYNGSPQPVTATTNPSGLNVVITYNGSSTVPSSAGSYAISATIVDPAYAGSATATQIISKAPATISFGTLSQTYDGTAKSATATTSPAGLGVSFTYNGSSTAPTNAGSYTVVGTINDPNYTGSSSGTLVISKATATVTLGSLSQTYNGSAKSATATTSPAGLGVSFTYNGSSTAPTTAGSYTVVGNVNDTNYTGSATGTLVISKASATVTLGSLSQTYNGSARSATATTSPAGLSVGFTYNGSATAPINAGSYSVSATISDTNYTGSATGTLVIAKATATVSLSGLSATYDGTQKLVAATTSPAGLTVGFTYDGSSSAPTNAGTYAIVATVNDSNYNGTASGSLVIAKAPATVTLGGLSATYDGVSKSATSITSPAGLTVGITYDGLPTPPVAAGSYATVATISDSNYSGTASGTLVISPASAVVTLGNLSPTYDGSPKQASVTTSPAGLATVITYNGLPTPPTHAGAYSVIASVTDPNYSGSGSGSLVIGKATASVSLGGLAQTYDGSTRTVSATTSPAGLNLTITYNGSPTPPVASGTYPVVATISDSDYQGSASALLVISKASATVTLGGLSASYDGNQKIVIASTSPSGLNVQLTYEGGVPPTHAGSYAVAATVDDPNYSGAASGTLEIAKAMATIELSGLSQVHDGSPKSVGTTTDPAGLSVSITYNGSSTPPSAAGSYAIIASITDANYTGSSSGTLVISNDLVVTASESLALPNTTTAYGNLLNDGTLTFGAGTVTISGNATNHGVLRLTGDAVLNVSGTFTNTGVIDIINWSGTLPPGLINSGSILDRSAIRVTSTSASASTFSLSVPGYAGHLYQLETKSDLTAAWQPLGSAIAGTGTATNPPALQFTPALDGPRRFYRVVVTPAP